MSPVSISYWAEGPTDRAVARKIIRIVGAEPGADYSARRGSASGKSYLDQHLYRFNEAAVHAPWFVLRDADQDCAPELIRRLLPRPSKYMCFRIAVPMVEAWLLSDREALARTLSVQVQRLPDNPESIADPKHLMVELARHSTSFAIRRAMIPEERSGRREGPEYSTYLRRFIDEAWNPERAARHAPSLRKAIERLRELAGASR